MGAKVRLEWNDREGEAPAEPQASIPLNQKGPLDRSRGLPHGYDGQIDLNIAVSLRSFGMATTRTQFVICVSNENCEDLVLRMVYRVIEDEEASQEGLLRVIDQSGEDFLYSALASCGLLCVPRKNRDRVLSPTPDAEMPHENLEPRVPGPTRAEIVEFIRLGLECDLLSIDAIRAWADSVIEVEDSPPNWSIDLAMAGPDDIHDIVRQIPLSATTDRPIELLLGNCACLWERKQIPLKQIAEVWWRASCNERGSGLLGRGPHVDAYYESFVDGFASRGEIHSLVDEAFRPFRKHVNDLPPCLRPA